MGRIYNTILEDEVETGKAREVGKIGLYIVQKLRRMDGVSKRPTVFSAMKRFRMM